MTREYADSKLHVPAKRYRIGELVQHSPFSRQTIHNYTIMGLIREVEWTEGGHRLYDESVFERLARIIELKKTKSITEIRRMLREEEGKSSSPTHEQSRSFSGPGTTDGSYDMGMHGTA